MSTDQGLAFAVIAGTMALLIWGRLRYDLVALAALLAGVACGIVPFDKAFTRLQRRHRHHRRLGAGRQRRDQPLRRRRAPDPAARPRTSDRPSLQVPFLVTAVTILSAFIKNVGALAIFLPIALQIAKRTQTPPSQLLMPLAFGSLLGGLATLIGTSPNIIVSRVREELTGEPFHMFDYLPVGAGLSLIGIAFLSFGWRLLPDAADRRLRARPSRSATTPPRRCCRRARPWSARRCAISKLWPKATSRSSPSSASTATATCRPATGFCSRTTCWCSRATPTRCAS